MPKNIDDVILPERRKSIRNIPIPEGRKRSDKPAKTAANPDSIRKPAPRVHEEPTEEAAPMPPRRNDFPRRRSLSRKRLWLSIGAATVILAFAVLSMFDSATLSYVPKSAAVTFNDEVFAAAKTGEGKLLYSVVKLSGDKSVSVPASGETQVSRKASGTIVVYNNASAEAQQLVENTRFESPGGKVYRVAKGITIPGKRTVSGKSQPGSVEAIVYADAPGESYNLGLTDFTVPGLKGTPRYTTIYARSKTPMAGGFVGTEKVVSESDLTKAKSDLRTALSEELTAKAQAEVPADFILLPSLSSVTFEDLPQSSSDDKGSVNVNLRGNLYGIMFKRSDLSRELARKKVSLSAAEQVDLSSFESLELSFNGPAPADLLPINEISFKVNGSAVILWRTDEVALRSDLVGRKKGDVSSILGNYPTIASADATLRPFWKTSFPDAGEKITIKKLKVQ